MENNNQLEQLEKIVGQFEEKLSWKRGGDITDRVSHCLSQYNDIAENAIVNGKNFLNDVKTQFKALEIITEGITGQDFNHGQKRVIANHIITMLRKMVDTIDQNEYTFSSNMFDRFNFFRSNTPERRLHEAHSELKRKSQSQEIFIAKIKVKHPEIFENGDELPF